jgi:hypothetical protein
MSDSVIKQLGVLLDLIITSSHDGEAAGAFHALRRKVSARGIRAADILGTSEDLDAANETIAQLLAENAALRTELECRNAQGGALVPSWESVGGAITNTKRTADWLLGLREQGIAWFSDWEVGFVTDIATRWSGPLTSNQCPVFQRIVDRIVSRTGQQPPA